MGYPSPAKFADANPDRRECLLYTLQLAVDERVFHGWGTVYIRHGTTLLTAAPILRGSVNDLWEWDFLTEDSPSDTYQTAQRETVTVTRLMISFRGKDLRDLLDGSG